MTAKEELGTEPERTIVLHVILSLEIGGMEQVVADLVRNLDKRRFRPVVACLESLGPIANELIDNGITVVRLAEMLPLVSFLYPAPLVRIIRETRASVIHAHSGCLYKAAIAGKMVGIHKIIYTEHGRHFPDKKLVMAFDRIFSRLTSRVVAVSRELAQYLHRSVGIPKDKIIVIQNGIRVENFNLGLNPPPKEEVVIGIIARLAPVKDIATLLRAMQIVVVDCPRVQLQIVGDGPEREALEQLSGTLGLRRHVLFRGFRRDVPALLSEIDIFALSSLSEGTSVTLLEAMAAGKPVVATRVGGNPSLIAHERNGFLVPPGQPDELARALLLLIRDPHLRRDIGILNRRKALEEFSVNAMVRQYENIYDESFPAPERAE